MATWAGYPRFSLTLCGGLALFLLGPAGCRDDAGIVCPQSDVVCAPGWACTAAALLPQRRDLAVAFADPESPAGLPIAAPSAWPRSPREVGQAPWDAGPSGYSLVPEFGQTR